MRYYENPENVREYIKMAEGYSGEYLIKKLREFLPDNSTLLELGIGPGSDLDILKQHYNVTGSDFAKPFLDLYRKKDPNIELHILDAIDLQIDKTFDAIYSNKVLYHLHKKELKQSLKRQSEILNPKGIVAHSFWKGDKEEDYLDLHFVYYKLSELRALFDPHFRILHLDYYQESKEGDSIYVVGVKR